MKRKHCMNCGTANLSLFIDLGEQPNGNNFPRIGEQDEEPLFDISMLVCEECWQVQIDEFPSQEFLFTNHPYISGVNQPIVEHFQWLSRHLITKLSIKQNSLVMDIGSNDGTLLNCFKENGMLTLGVDPGKPTGKLAKENGILVCEAFWNKNAGKAMRTLCVYPDLITATAVFYHLPDLHDFLVGIKEIMHKDSVFTIQCVNLLDLINKNQFDHFYHEHSCIHSISPLDKLFKMHGMRVFDVEFIDVHGGSFLLYTCLDTSKRLTEDSVGKAIKMEIDAGLQSISTYHDFAKRVKKNCYDLKELLEKINSQGERVFALGAPVKGNTLLNYAELTNDHISIVTEVNHLKIGHLTPGTHIPIVHEDEIEEQPDYYLVLSWNFLDFFMKKYKKFLINGGKFIVPVPEVKILGFETVSS